MNNKFKKILSIALTVLLLSNNANAIVAERIDTDTSGFNNNLSASDNNVQDALNTIDNLIASADGSTKGTASFNASDFNSSSGNISLDYTNAQSASASNKGFLTSSDWTTFNNKFTLPSLTSGSVLFSDGSTIAQDNTKFYFNDSTDSLYTYSTLTERVLNGGFTGNANNWTLNSGWAYSSNSVSHSSNGTGVLTQSMSNIVKGKMYKLTYTISGWTVGTVTPTCGGNTLTARSANGTYTEYFVNTNANAAISFTPSNTARFTIDNVSVVEFSGGNVNTGTVNTQSLNVASSTSNSSPGTTRHITLSNAGSYTYIDAYFGSTLGGAIGMTSSAMNLYAGSSGINFYKTPTSPSLIAYISDGAMMSYGVVGGNTGVVAGNTSTSQPSTLTDYGSFGAKHVYISENTTLTGSYTYVDANADLGSSCSGSITYTCSHWTNQTDCELRDSHGGCSWSVITCSDYNYTDQSTCESGHAGCTWESTSCSGGYDESSCISQDDSYGGNCTWDGTDCSGLDESSCGSTSGCSTNYSDCSSFNDDYTTCIGTSGCSSSSMTDCSAYDGTDQSTCESNTGCYWDGMSNCYMTCSGTYYSGCSGTYYACNGSYYTGGCTGSGGSCSGTSICSGIDDQTNCNNEGGCSWTTGLSLTMPTEGGFSTNFMRTYFIRNIGASANLTLYPNTDQTINGTTSLVVAAGKARHISFSWFQVACSTWNDTGESTCESGHSGCEWTSCSGLDETACGEAGGQCSWDGMTCNGGGNCNGTWNVRRDWTVYGGVF